MVNWNRFAVNLDFSSSEVGEVENGRGKFTLSLVRLGMDIVSSICTIVAMMINSDYLNIRTYSTYFSIESRRPGRYSTHSRL